MGVRPLEGVTEAEGTGTPDWLRGKAGDAKYRGAGTWVWL